jgi:hypothetical protein
MKWITPVRSWKVFPPAHPPFHSPPSLTSAIQRREFQRIIVQKNSGWPEVEPRFYQFAHIVQILKWVPWTEVSLWPHPYRGWIFKELLRSKLRLTWGWAEVVRGLYCSNIEQNVLTWGLLYVPILCMLREAGPKVSLRFTTCAQNDTHYQRGGEFSCLCAPVCRIVLL